MNTTPDLVWSSRQRLVSARLMRLSVVRQAVRSAAPLVADAAIRGSAFCALPEISFVFVSDARIAALHGEFMNDPSPTDVITFLHGEIVISAETAEREARRRGLPLPEEIARYAVHGMLHLAGWSDSVPRAAAAMRTIQEKILRRARRGLC